LGLVAIYTYTVHPMQLPSSRERPAPIKTNPPLARGPPVANANQYCHYTRPRSGSKCAIRRCAFYPRCHRYPPISVNRSSSSVPSEPVLIGSSTASRPCACRPYLAKVRRTRTRSDRACRARSGTGASAPALARTCGQRRGLRTGADSPSPRMRVRAFRASV
jgi:hypothetical protein